MRMRLLRALMDFLHASSITTGRSGWQVPHLLSPECISPNLLIVRKEYAWHIGGALSQNELEEWRLLYHSAVNGLSFNTFFGHISKEDGPTVLLIKDKEGYIYGGYASQPWERHGDFYGDLKSFLFQLHPRASIYRPTGVNNNLQWVSFYVGIWWAFGSLNQILYLLSALDYGRP